MTAQICARTVVQASGSGPVGTVPAWTGYTPAMIITWIATTLAVWATATLLPGFTVRNGMKGALVVGAVFGVLNALLRKFLVGVIKVGTLGLASLLGPLVTWLAVALLLVLTDKLSDTLKIKNFPTAFVGAIPITIGVEVVSRALRALF